MSEDEFLLLGGMGKLHCEPSQEPRAHSKAPPEDFQLQWGNCLTWKVSACTFPVPAMGFSWSSVPDPCPGSGHGPSALSPAPRAVARLHPYLSPPSIPVTWAGSSGPWGRSHSAWLGISSHSCRKMEPAWVVLQGAPRSCSTS